MATRKSRDEDCCSVNFLKYVLHIFNVVFLLAGVVVLAVGVWTLISKHQYTVLLTSASFPVAAIVLVLAGCLALGVAVLGCCGVWREHRCLILVYTFMLLLIFLLEVMVGILAYIYQGYVKDELYQNLNTTFLESYNVDASRTAAIDRIQQEFKCCGAIRFEDWEVSLWQKGPPPRPASSVPDSCCKTTSEGCGKRNHPSNIYYTSLLNMRLLAHRGLHLQVGRRSERTSYHTWSSWAWHLRVTNLWHGAQLLPVHQTQGHH